MEKLILTEVEVEAICEKLAHEMDKQMDKDESNLPILLGIMNGALPFMYQLVKSIKHPNQIDTMQVSSYNGTASTGELIIKTLKDCYDDSFEIKFFTDKIDDNIIGTLEKYKDYEVYDVRCEQYCSLPPVDCRIITLDNRKVKPW